MHIIFKMSIYENYTKIKISIFDNIHYYKLYTSKTTFNGYIFYVNLFDHFKM